MVQTGLIWIRIEEI